MAAKLGCSGRYITGLNEQQVKSDLASYSGLYSLVTITNDDTLYLSLIHISEPTRPY